MAIDTDRDTVFVNAQQDRDAMAHMAKIEELKLRRELAILDYANKKEMSLDQVKKDLAKTAMIERTRKEIAAAEIALADKTSNNSLIRDEVSTDETP
jgi:hypothetical protein